MEDDNLPIDGQRDLPARFSGDLREGMKRLHPREATRIIANTSTKCFMRIEEMSETARLKVADAEE